MACTTVSMESAIISLEGNEYRIPGVPIEMPSLTPIVLKINPITSSFKVPCLTNFAKSFRCILHGLPSYPVLAIPTSGFLKSSLVNPMACNIACAAGCVGSCVTALLYLFNSFIFYFVRLSEA